VATHSHVKFFRGVGLTDLLVGLAIVYNFFIDKLSKLEGWSGFFAELLFFLPCLLDDFVKYIMNEINITPNSVYVFIVIEILLILIYFYLPQLVGQFTNDKDNSIVLLNLPKKINKEEFKNTKPNIDFSETDNFQQPEIEISDLLTKDELHVSIEFRA
jgi:hypothetical protein